MKKRVVITGMGTINSIGKDTNEFWENSKAGVCGIDYIKMFDTEEFNVKIAAEVKNFNPTEHLDKRDINRMDRYSQFALIAAKEAMLNAKVEVDNIDKNRLGVFLGTAIGGISTLEQEHTKLITKGPRRISPIAIPASMGNSAAANIAIKFGAKGMCNTLMSACASGTNAIGDAYRILQSDIADIIIAGGAEAPITPLTIGSFSMLTALSKSNDPNRASIPFDAERSGFVAGEGAGILILETLEHAKARGANILAEIVGYELNCDAFHLVVPEYSGECIGRAINSAIKEANITIKDISYINAHGTGTPHNDKIETNAIKKVFGEHAFNIPISSIKSMIGHSLGASGAIEAITCVKVLQEGIIPPTIGYKVPDPECDLNYVPNHAIQKECIYTLSNSLGFGGHNAVLIIKKWVE